MGFIVESSLNCVWGIGRQTVSLALRVAAAIAGGVAVSDQYRRYVTSLLHGDSTNGKTNSTFIDGSDNNTTITPTGTPTQGAFSPFGLIGEFSLTGHLTT